MARIVLLALFCLMCFGKCIVGGPLFREGNDGGLFDDLSDKPLLKAMLLKNVFGGSAGGDGGPPPVLKAMLLKKIFGESLGEEGVPAPLESALNGIYHPISSRLAMQNEDSTLLTKFMLYKTMATNIGMKMANDYVTMMDERIVYTFALSLTWNNALEYTTDAGEMKGFHIDLITEVCKEAGKKCVIVYDPAEKCINHNGLHFVTGQGLAEHEYDACFGWYNTTERQQVHSFTEPYWKVENKYHLYVKAGNPNGFDPTDITGKTIGFVSAWAGGHPCLSSLTGADAMTPDYAVNMDVLIDNLEADKVDAIFLGQVISNAALDRGFERIGQSFSCAESTSVHGVTRKDEELPWFSETLKEMKDNGKYYGICAKARQYHGAKGDVSCI